MAKIPSKSNKTSHVLNLLTGADSQEVNPSEANASSEDHDAAEEMQNSVLQAPFNSEDLRELSENVKSLSHDIGTLTEGLQNTVAASREMASALEAVPQKETFLSETLDTGDTQTPNPDTAEDTESSVEKPAEKTKEKGFSDKNIVVVDNTLADALSGKIQKKLEETVFGEAKVQEGFHIVNVMQEILKGEDIFQYMVLGGCCTCERCQADVLAAALTRLPSKYVVMYRKSTSPRISYYHERYKMDIFTAIMRAINDVKTHPHHDDNNRM